jgi:hypothetical protein
LSWGEETEMPKTNYDPEKDITIAEVAEIESEDGNITIRVMQYNGGTPKVALNRKYYTRKGEVRTKALGRLTEADLKGLGSALSKAKKALTEASQKPEEAS